MFQKIYKGLQNILLVVAVILIASTVLCLAFKVKPCVVMSGSMEPKIMTGSLAFIKENETAPKEGEIISFRKGEISVVHRIIKRTDGGYVTKGDANDVEDPGILKQKDILGSFLFSIPKLGYAVKFLQTIKGIGMTVCGILAFILFGFLVEKE